MRFQIEKRCCGSEVIASQSWKSYKKWMLGGGRCDVEVVRPKPATKCMQLLGEHHCITFQLHMQKKMKVSTPAAFEQSQSAPKSQPKFSQWGGVCFGGAARRVCRFGVCRLHCEHALIMLDLYS